MENKDKLYKKCLLRGIAAISMSKSKVSIMAKYIKARRSFFSNLKNGEKELSAFSIALFDAADWDFDKHIAAMNAVNDTLKEHRLSKK